MRLIITADWHIRYLPPRCRRETQSEWMETQQKALEQVLKYAVQNSADVAVVGDVFHSNSSTNFETIQVVQKFAYNLSLAGLKLFVLCGNHDLLYHSSENLNRSAIGILLNTDNVYHISQLYFGDWRLGAANFDGEIDRTANVVFQHILCFPTEKEIPFGIEAVCAEDLVCKYRKAKWIFTGDYHKNFCSTFKKCKVVNPGCLLRQASDFKDYQCGVYLVDFNEDFAEFLCLKDKWDLVDDSYITAENEREDRIGKFVDKLKDVQEVSLDFLQNVEKAKLESNLSNELKKVIDELVDI